MVPSLAPSMTTEHVVAEIADSLEIGLHVYQVDDPLDAGSMRLIYANPASARAIGLDLVEKIGQPMRDAFPGLMDMPLPAIYLEIALGGVARNIGDVWYGDDLVPRQLFSVRAFPLADQSVGLSFTNLTAQHLVEQQAIQTLESMSDAFVTLDSEWRFTYLNPQSEPILERRREDLLGKNMWNEFPEGVGTLFYHEYHRAIRDQVTVQIEETFLPLGRVLDVRAYPITNGLALYFRDVTAQRRVEAQLGQTQRLESLGRLAAGVAHDFNNLLTGIRGYANLGVAASCDAEKAGRYFASIDQASQTAADLTRQLLAFAREQDLEPASLDMNHVVQRFSSLLRQLLAPEIELMLDLSEAPVPTFVDRSQLEQVLLNLVVNGRDAIERKGSITIRTSTTPPDGLVDEVTEGSAWLQITDTGSGIPEDVLPKIFEPFFSTKPSDVGTGLGLATIYGIVSQSGGEIYVASTVDVGTCMTVSLPAMARRALARDDPKVRSLLY
jgi:signal transduction histidine kinase